MNGLDYVGLFSMQLIEEVWPATAGINLQQPTISEAFERSVYVPQVGEEDEEDFE